MIPVAEPEAAGLRDVRNAIELLAAWLPEPLHPLAELAFNYRWSWLGGADDLFHEIEPVAWERSGRNPRRLIETIPQRRLETLAGDVRLVAKVHAVAKLLRSDLERAPRPGPFTPEHPVAYLCAEFAIHSSLPIYSGGLGVLAGDLLKAASDLALPMVGLGLMYRQGYFCQRLDDAGLQHEYWMSADFDRLPIALVTGSDGRPVVVQVPIRGRAVRVQAWRVNVGRVPLYLLDTDRDDNAPIDRWITARLYVADSHTRLAQYSILGIGGAKMLRALGLDPALYHLNEGHGALSSFERLRELMAFSRDQESALAQVRSRTVFTTHTPVEAGNEGYREAEVEAVLAGFLDELALPRSLVFGLGRHHPEDRNELAKFTPLALRTSRVSNGVSRRHGAVSRSMWRDLWPERALESVPIRHVTNGVHTTTWMAAPMQQLLDRHLGPDWRERLGDGELWSLVDAIPDEELWSVRCELRRGLVEYVRVKSVRDRLERGEAPDYVEAASRAFDPDVLTIGFARRVATYKRLHLLTRFPERALTLLDGARPIQIVLAGKAHPADEEAKRTLSHIFALKRSPIVGGRVAFLENYDLEIGRRIVAGVDVWVNLPRPPLEASGTSGMKATLNGVLNLSVLDGWWAEAFDGENGWGISTPEGSPDAQDDHDATALLDILEREVIPLFGARDADGVPRGWTSRVKASMRSLIPAFTAERMLLDYLDTMYAPRSPHS